MREISIIVRIFCILILVILSSSFMTYAYIINVTVTIPIEQYAIYEAFPHIVHVYTLLSGETNPHYTPLRPSMIRIVEKSLIYVPLWHFPIEYRIAHVVKRKIIVITLEDYKRHGLKFLRYPETDIPDTHGWWLNPYNMLALIETLKNYIIRIDPKDRTIVTFDYEMFKNRIIQLSRYLRTLGRSIKKYCKNVIIVCANPATLYIIHDLGLQCIVVREEQSTEILKLFNTRKPLLILLAKFQKGTKIDWFYQSLIRKYGGTVLYVDTLGSVNVNITYTGLLYTIGGEIYGSCLALSHEAHRSGGSNRGSELVYVTYVLAVLLAICVIIIISMFRRGYRF